MDTIKGKTMRVTVCELGSNWMVQDNLCKKLIGHLAENKSDFLLLPEMSLYEWLPGSPTADGKEWDKSVCSHDTWIERFAEFNVPFIAGTRPVLENDIPYNEGFVWSKKQGYLGVHKKYYLPDENGFWENTWYKRGDGNFTTVRISGMNIGFLICTELWFSQHAREYAKQGIHLLLCPRATPSTSSGTWLAGGRAAANVSGAFCLSSNFSGKNTSSIDFGGTGWIIEPEEGNVLGKTDQKEPFVTIRIDLAVAEKAKSTYPRYVAD